MNKPILFRIIYDSILLASVLFASWWCTLLFCFIGVILFRHYYECVFIGVLLDILYGTPYSRLIDISIVFTAVAFVLFAASSGFKTHIRLYE